MGSPKSDDQPGVWLQDLDAYPEEQYEFTTYDGYRYELKRMPGWNWNGYVYLPSTHPYFTKEYSEIEHEFHVHGDLTYGKGDGCFGFDCCHFGTDVVPGDLYSGISFPKTDCRTKRYWTFDMVKRETESLLEQFRNKSN